MYVTSVSLLLHKLWSKLQLLIDILAVQYSKGLVGIWYNQTGSGTGSVKSKTVASTQELLIFRFVAL